MKINWTDFKSQNKKAILWVGLFLILLVVVMISILIVSLIKTRQTAKSIIASEEVYSVPALDWSNEEIRTAYKEKLWLENQLSLTKEDSLSLGINLKDSIIQIQIKGLPLIRSKISYMKPDAFLSDIDATIYSKLFGHPTTFVNGKANLIKRPIRRMKVVSGSTAEPISSDSIKSGRFYWEFVSDNKIRIVINGCDYIEDSIVQKPSLIGDMLRFRLKRKSKGIDFKGYYPTLFLWINDSDAKAIYRALPEKTKLIIRN